MAKESIQKEREILVKEGFLSNFDLAKNKGSLSGGASISNGVLSIDGTDGHAIFNNRPSLIFIDADGTDSAFSIRAKVKLADATEFPIVSKGVYNSHAEYRILVAANDKIYWQVFDESVADCYIGRAYDTVLTTYEGEWIEIVCTYNGGGTSSDLKIYLNGVQVDDADGDNESGSYVAMEDQGQPVHIGRNATLYGEGEVDFVEFWDRVLSDEEISNLYEGKRFKALHTSDEILNISAQSGSIASKYEGKPTWLMDAGKGTFDSGIESWSVYGTNTIENDDGALKIVYVDDGSGAKTSFRGTHDIDGDLIVGKTYKVRVKTKGNAGIGYNWRVWNGAASINGSWLTGIDYVWDEITFIAGSTTGCYLRLNSFTAGEIVWIDEWYVVEVEQAPVLTDMAVHKDGQAMVMLFNGTSGIQVGDAGTFEPTSISVIAWVKRTLNESGAAIQAIVVSGDGVSHGYGLSYVENSTNEWRFAIDPDGGVGVYTGINSDDKVVANQWYLLIGTYDAISTEMELYVNAVKQSGSTTVAQIDYDSSESTTIGMLDGGGGKFLGFINDVRLCEGVLTANQISQIYTSEKWMYGL